MAVPVTALGSSRIVLGPGEGFAAAVAAGGALRASSAVEVLELTIPFPAWVRIRGGARACGAFHGYGAGC